MRKSFREIRKLVSKISPKLSSKIMYRVIMKKNCNLKNPQTFNEKIQWLKLNYWPNNKLAIQCSDKYKVRAFVEDRGCGEYLNELYYCWNSPEEIEWEKLPEKFVIKCNHGCAYNIICNDKSQLSEEKTKKQLSKWMKEDFSLVSAEPHYNKIERKIICEKYLEDDIKDYKFFCFNGEPKFFYISQGDLHNMKADFFYVDGKKADFKRIDHETFEKEPSMPVNLEKMIEESRKLSNMFPFVRVDWFEVAGKMYFSELTFSPCTGMMPLSPDDADYKLGQLFKCGGEKDE